MLIAVSFTGYSAAACLVEEFWKQLLIGCINLLFELFTQQYVVFLQLFLCEHSPKFYTGCAELKMC